MLTSIFQSKKLLIACAIKICAWSTTGFCDDDYQNCLDRYSLDNHVNVSSLERLANNGDIEARYCLGVIYHDGKGVKRDLRLAIDWYAQAGQKGHVEAQYWLCLMYRDGIGIESSALESMYWCKRAAKQNHANALYALGQLYYGGIHPNRLVNAHIWFTRAKEAGEMSAMAMINLIEKQMTDLQIREAKKLRLQDEL